MDWMIDETFDEHRLLALTVIDRWSRVCPVIRVCRSATAVEVIEALEKAKALGGLLLASIQVDRGAPFTLKELDLWAYANDVVLDLSRPGQLIDTY